MKIPTARVLLKQLGIGDFNATMIIPFVFMAPATTDPKQPSTLMMVRHIQRALHQMGSRVAESGLIDRMTADNLQTLMGPGWLNKSWAQVISTVVAARDSKVRLTPTAPGPEDFAPPMSGLGFLPDVPGGMITYAAGAVALWWYLTKKKPAPSSAALTRK